ncbi:hypothetical protein HY626_04300 [Candidatus Uhrbacteria bacterium]|nr:hypothetical protein [Candidatus Uhrbacteria bacterium]
MPSTESETTTVRTHGHAEGHNMTKRKGLLATVVGTVSFEGELEPWTHKPARDGRPEMYRSKVNGVEIWLKGVTPPKTRSPIVGAIEVKSNQVTQHVDGGDEVSEYLYVNVLPLPEGTTPTVTVSIVRPPKVGQGKDRVKILPQDFDEATDFVVERQGQPWQVITVR